MSESGTPKSKVARLIDEYDLSEMGSELERRWTRAEDRSSLRELARWFNEQLLRTELERDTTGILDGEVENLYRLLSAEDVTSGTREEARHRLEQRGVDVDALEGDFVSHESMRTYLRNERDATPPTRNESAERKLTKKRETIQRLQTRLRTVASQSLRELSEAGHLTLGDVRVTVNVRVHCADCDTRRSVVELLRRGGCDCSE